MNLSFEAEGCQAEMHGLKVLIDIRCLDHASTYVKTTPYIEVVSVILWVLVNVGCIQQQRITNEEEGNMLCHQLVHSFNGENRI